VGIPTVPFVESSTNGTYSLKSIKSIIVDAQYQDSVDSDGQTLIPPTLMSFAQTFGEDLAASVGLNVSVLTGCNATVDSIFLTLGNASDYLDAARRATSEGYTIDVTTSGLIVKGASPLGAWWATRSILQQAVLGDLQISLGTATDAPGWGIRGLMVCLLYLWTLLFITDTY
jgi:hexosaminidase